VTCVREIGDGESITWFSSRSGWGHLYLLDAQTGEERCQLTSGAWNVHDIVHVDEADRWIYFTACGREAERDPYYRHLYRCSFDDGQLELLTPEDADHDVAFSPSGAYLVDTFSRIDQPQTIVLRAADGRLVTELEQAAIAAIQSAEPGVEISEVAFDVPFVDADDVQIYARVDGRYQEHRLENLTLENVEETPNARL